MKTITAIVILSIPFVPLFIAILFIVFKRLCKRLDQIEAEIYIQNLQDSINRYGSTD